MERKIHLDCDTGPKVGGGAESDMGQSGQSKDCQRKHDLLSSFNDQVLTFEQ